MQGKAAKKRFLSCAAILILAAQLSAVQQPKTEPPKKPASLTDEERDILEYLEILQNMELLHNFEKIRYYEYFADGKKPEQKKGESPVKASAGKNGGEAK